MRAGNVLLFAALMLSACGSSNSVSGSGNMPGPLQPKAQTYYVDANEGNDEADGTSPQKAWRTVARASKQVLKAGDQLLLHRGQTFSGELDIRAEGTQAEPVFVSGYGNGQRPVVVGHDASMWAVRVLNSSHITLRGLEIINTGSERLAGRTGLKVECRDHGISADIMIDSIYVHDVNGSLVKEQGGGSGILIENGGNMVASRFEGLTIQNCHIQRCERNAMIWTAYYDRRNWLPNTGVVVRSNLIEQVPGDGIVPIGCEGTLIEYNVMRDCPDLLPMSEAAAGIWPWSCDNTVIQFNEVSDHKAPWDAQGFDCDFNCRNTQIRYNYSHDNYGGMVLICDAGKERGYSLGNIGSRVEWNISIGDGQRPKITRTGSIFAPNIHIAGRVTNTLVAHNILHSSPKLAQDADRTMICADSWDGYADSTTITRNIFYTAEPSQFNMTKTTRNLFLHNWYLGEYRQLPADAEAQTSLAGKTSTDGKALLQLMDERDVCGYNAHFPNPAKMEAFFKTLE